VEIVLFVMLGVAVGFIAWVNLAQSGKPPERGSAAPPFELEGSDGASHSLASLAGKRAVLFFFPQDDTPECIAAITQLRDAHEAIAASGAALLAIGVGSAESARKYAGLHQLTFPILADRDGKVARRYGSLINTGFGKFARKLVVVVNPAGRVERTFRDVEVDTPGHVDRLLGALAADGL
jgi:thioredoxin-dependent peroxiredoxin